MKTYLALSVILVVLITVASSQSTETCDELCYCPCISPDDDSLISPSMECLQRIKCQFGKSVCSAEVMACQKPPTKEPCFCPCRIPGCPPDVLYYPSQSCLQTIRCKFGENECTVEHINGGGK